MWEKMITVADQGHASDVNVQFHTNGTIWNDDYVRILPKFKHVQIAVSIDSHNTDQLKYIRHQVDVDALYKNFERYIALSKEHDNITVNICFTVSVYNIWYADTILKEFARHGVSVTTNVVYGPDQYDFRHLPWEIKNIIVKRFTGNSTCQTLISLLNHQLPGCDIWWPRLWQEIRVLDRTRNQSFAETFPEYYQALLPYIPNEPS
jgi:sulfatase maturation enzyme AslB (radical SAM superfamily)